jgi:hypothetical protein
MDHPPNDAPDEKTLAQARRVRRILYLLMFFGMALPFLLVWWTGRIGSAPAP